MTENLADKLDRLNLDLGEIEIKVRLLGQRHKELYDAAKAYFNWNEAEYQSNRKVSDELLQALIASKEIL